MSKMRTYEYVWLDGYKPEPNLRSKIKATAEETTPDWSFDGSSTQQAGTGDSDCLLLPVQSYENPTEPDYIVLCQVHGADHKVHPTNTRAAAAEIVTDEWWFGFEQEYYLTHPDGTILGWEHGDPRPQGEYYCGVGASNIAGREISEAHLLACLEAGIEITGTNAEVGLGQWEYQCFGKGIKAADDLWVSRYILNKIAEEHGVCVNYHPKPKKGDWNGSGMHTNFSNDVMRTKGDKALFDEICGKLEKCHDEAIAAYGSDNDMRLTGSHETQVITKFSHGVSDRGASIRIPVYTVEHGWKGYLEDRRPSSNADPYLIVAHIVGALK
tara:strand:- start:1034 stop:2011 length:978 start_codon:yes stop_codon:yes gene_type:complete